MIMSLEKLSSIVTVKVNSLNNNLCRMLYSCTHKSLKGLTLQCLA